MNETNEWTNKYAGAGKKQTKEYKYILYLMQYITGMSCICYNVMKRGADLDSILLKAC